MSRTKTVASEGGGMGHKSPGELGADQLMALGQTKYFDMRDVVDQATKQGLILSIPVLSVPNNSGILPIRWANDPQLMADVTSKSIALFEPPLALPPMDLSVVPATYGLEQRFPEGHSQIQTTPSTWSIEEAATRAGKLPELEGKPLGVRLAALELLHEKHPKQLFGEYVPGPLTLAAMLANDSEVLGDVLLVEGPGSSSPIDRLLSASADRSIDVARLMVKKGVKVIAVLDPTATQDVISPSAYKRLLPYTRRVVEGIHDAGASAVLHVCGFTKSIAGMMAESGADIISMDCRPKKTAEKVLATTKDIVDVLRVFEKGGIGVRLMTGLQTPEIEKMSTTEVEASTRDLIAIAKKHPRSFVMSSTCEIPERVPVKNLQRHFEMVRAARL